MELALSDFVAIRGERLTDVTRLSLSLYNKFSLSLSNKFSFSALSLFLVQSPVPFTCVLIIRFRFD